MKTKASFTRKLAGGGLVVGGVAAIAFAFNAGSKNAESVARPLVTQGREVKARAMAPVVQNSFHPGSRAAFDALCAQLVEEGKAADLPSAVLTLMNEYADADLGLYAFQVACDEGIRFVAGQPLAEFCRVTRERHANTAVAAMALSRELKVVSTASESEFLELCERVLAEGGDPAQVRVALLRRAEWLRDRGEAKQAAADYLRLWSEQPEKAKELRLEVSTRACLREAGYILEAEIFDTHSEPEAFAADLLSEMREGTSAAASYFRNAPRLAQFIDASAGQELSAADEALHWARAGRLAIYLRDASGASEAYQKFAEAAARYAASSEIELREYSRFAPVQREVCASAEFFFGDGELARSLVAPEVRPGANERRALIRSLASSRETLSDAAFAAASKLGAEEAARLTELEAQVEVAGKRFEEAVRVQERFIDAFPDADETIKVLMSAAETYKQHLKKPAQAAELFGRAAELDPDSPVAIKAKLEQGLSFYEAKAYEDALLSLEEFAALYPADPRRTSADFFSALCEAALGLVDEAEQRVAELLSEHPTCAIAPDAYYWMGSSLAARQEHERAVFFLDELQARFPGNKYEMEAQRLRQQLAETTLARN